ncbi:MAG: hypothetical protein WC428_01275 [Candidatus Paceibacterota bacterium]
MEHENFKFRQEIKNSSFYNFESFSNDFDVDVNESDLFINWHIGFWLNDFGVENFFVEIDGVDGTYKVVLLNKQSDEVEQENDKNIAEFPWKFKVTEANLRLGKTLYVDTLDFDFKTKICTVTFFDEENQY